MTGDNDPEIEAIQTCLVTIERLDQKARQRVLKYLNDRFDYRSSGGPPRRMGQRSIE